MDSHFDEFRRLFVEERMRVSSIYERFERKVTRVQLMRWCKQVVCGLEGTTRMCPRS